MNETGKPEKESLFDRLARNDLYRKIIIAACVVGIALILLSGLFKNDKVPDKATTSVPVVTSDQYASQLESRLTDIVTRIQGTGTAKVLVTLDRSTEYVYATEDKASNQTTEDKSGDSSTRNQVNGSTEKKYVIVKDADGSEKALAITEVQPIIKGVVVVCDGGNNPAVQENIISAVTTALDISSTRVCVIKAK
ncbi:MAG TPA: stage III sporulation protein AG [Caproiciproducens sp.]|nr:stage III sporulation protein AG [Caproiciproducens sp.]